MKATRVIGQEGRSEGRNKSEIKLLRKVENQGVENQKKWIYLVFQSELANHRTEHEPGWRK